MPKRIPIATAKAVAKRHPDVRQVILIAWDGKTTHVVTWGKSVDDCAQAAHAGNLAKNSFGWPEELCKDEPYRVQKLKERIRGLEFQAPAQTDERPTVMDTERCAYCGHNPAQHTDKGCQAEDLVKVTSHGKATKLSRCGCDGYEVPAQEKNDATT